MSLTDFTSEHPIEVTPSEVESARFGYEIGRCTVPLSSNATPEDIASEILSKDPDMTFLRYPADRVSWFDLLTRQLEDHVLLHTDTLVYWELEAGSGRAPAPVESLETASPTDMAMIGDLTSRIFSGYANHYAANQLLSPEAAAVGYREWAMKASLHDSLVLLMDDLPVGLATLEVATDEVEILLAGMAPAHRGQGLYPHLLSATETRALESSASKVVISTQSHNTNVQRAWARYGFLPLTSLITVHVVKKALRDSSAIRT